MPQTEMVEGSETGNDSEDEQSSNFCHCSISGGFMATSRSGCMRNGFTEKILRLNVLWRDGVLKLSVVCRNLRPNGMTEPGVQAVLCRG